MHDFIQNLSFSSPLPAPRAASEPLRRLTMSFNEVPASFRPSPTASPRKRRKLQAQSQVTSHKS
jgi:hypothetical protein